MCPRCTEVNTRLHRLFLSAVNNKGEGGREEEQNEVHKWRWGKEGHDQLIQK